MTRTESKGPSIKHNYLGIKPFTCHINKNSALPAGSWSALQQYCLHEWITWRHDANPAWESFQCLLADLRGMVQKSIRTINYSTMVYGEVDLHRNALWNSRGHLLGWLCHQSSACMSARCNSIRMYICLWWPIASPFTRKYFLSKNLVLPNVQRTESLNVTVNQRTQRHRSNETCRCLDDSVTNFIYPVSTCYLFSRY